MLTKQNAEKWAISLVIVSHSLVAYLRDDLGDDPKTRSFIYQIITSRHKQTNYVHKNALFSHIVQTGKLKSPNKRERHVFLNKNILGLSISMDMYPYEKKHEFLTILPLTPKETNNNNKINTSRQITQITFLHSRSQHHG